MSNARLVLIHALSPLHCGTGQAVSGIDLPIAREKPTGIPLVPGSSIKGVLRARSASAKLGAMHTAVFGPETQNASDHAGSVQFSDANLVFLPVRSVRGTFAWVTSTYMLKRLARDAREAGIELALPAGAPVDERAWVTSDVLQADKRVVLEDFDFQAEKVDQLRKTAETVASWLFDDQADRAFFADRVCVLSENVVRILLDTAMEVSARIRLDVNTKTVDKGALWTEEALPIESILAGLVVATPVKPRTGEAPQPAALLDHVTALTDGVLQIGGNATVGCGMCRVRVKGGA